MIYEPESKAVTEALLKWRDRKIAPTPLSSEEIREYSSEIRMRSVFSARTTNAEYLQEIAETVDGMLAGKFAMSEGRYCLFKKLKQLGYDPETGFPDDMAAIPPATRDSLRDLSSDQRITLVLETNMRMAANYGRMVEGNTPEARYAYPAWELVRLYSREVERGTLESHSAGWIERWHNAGDAVDWEGAEKTPMVALKDSPIWQALGDGVGGYQDTLSNPFPPFAFNTGMAWKTVNRNRCVALGLITEDEIPEEMEGQLTAGEKEINDVFSKLDPDLRAEMIKEIEEYNRSAA
jgi:hypothetical protein